MSERGKPFVAWMSKRKEPFVGRVTKANNANELVVDVGSYMADLVGAEVVVTPLLPGDPKPGETWSIMGEEGTATIVSAPYDTLRGRREVVVRRDFGGMWESRQDLSELTPVPPEKTYRLRGAHTARERASRLRWVDFTVTASSKEEALKKLSDALEEVES